MDKKDNTALIYPNPTSGKSILEIESVNDEIAKVSVLNLQGQVIKEQEFYLQIGKNQVNFDLQEFANGEYFYSVKTSDTTINGKISKQ